MITCSNISLQKRIFLSFHIDLLIYYEFLNKAKRLIFLVKNYDSMCLKKLHTNTRRTKKNVNS